MTVRDPLQLFPKLEATGEDDVRINLARGTYGHDVMPLVQTWLSGKETVRAAEAAAKRDAREEETLSIAKKALSVANDANRIASEDLAIARSSAASSAEAAAAARSQATSAADAAASARVQVRWAMWAAIIAVIAAMIAAKDQIVALIA